MRMHDNAHHNNAHFMRRSFFHYTKFSTSGSSVLVDDSAITVFQIKCSTHFKNKCVFSSKQYYRLAAARYECCIYKHGGCPPALTRRELTSSSGLRLEPRPEPLRLPPPTARASAMSAPRYQSSRAAAAGRRKDPRIDRYLDR